MQRLGTILATVAIGIFASFGTAAAASTSSTTSTITVTFADEGHSYTMHQGERLDVQLSNAAISTWTEPSSSNPAVLKRLSGTSGEAATAVFVADNAGRADVTAIGTPSCAPVCDLLVLFEVKITVIGG